MDDLFLLFILKPFIRRCSRILPTGRKGSAGIQNIAKQNFKAEPFLLCWQSAGWIRAVCEEESKPALLDLSPNRPCSNILASILALPPQQIDPPVKGARRSPLIPKKIGKFRASWLTLYPWLKYDKSQNIMFCTYCRKWSHELTVNRSSFIEGNSNFRLEIVNHHDKCKAHKYCRDRESFNKTVPSNAI